MFKKKIIEEEEFDLYASNIKSVVGVDIFKNKRSLKYVVCRALFCHIVKKYYPDTTLHGIKRMFNKRGKKYDHATVLHALKCFQSYISPKYGFKYSEQRNMLNKYTLQDLYKKIAYEKGTLEVKKQYLKEQVERMNTKQIKNLEQFIEKQNNERLS